MGKNKKGTREMNANEQFIVKHYSEDERPTLKGHGFDGLVIGDDRQEAQDFVDYLNTMLRQQQAEIEALKQQLNPPKSTNLGPWQWK